MRNTVKVDNLQRPVKIEIISPNPTTIAVGDGERGLPGIAGPQQIYYQDVSPPIIGIPWLWFETDGIGDVINLWINDGNA